MQQNLKEILQNSVVICGFPRISFHLEFLVLNHSLYEEVEVEVGAVLN